MTTDIPTGRISRTMSTGKIAAKITGRQVKYLVKRPFLSEAGKKASKKQRDQDSARILFKGLSLLRGTALKAAQMLSFEKELLPESFQKELGKAYCQVPPINRSLVRKIISTNLGSPPENLFDQFDTQAFAGASLGQVHRARAGGKDLAVKIQYPDMKKTIDNDLTLLTAMVRPLPEYELIRAALEEIREVLVLETDYERERENLEYFAADLNLEGVVTPDIVPELCSDRVLTMGFLEGPTLSQWLGKKPDQKSRNRVAQTLNDIFIRGFYGLNCIHADPNPGNFLIMDEDRVGLLDFGCVRSVDPEFVSRYRKLIRLGGSGDRAAYQDLLFSMGMLSKDVDKKDLDDGISLFMKMGTWINQLFQTEFFDFKENSDFLAQGQKLGRDLKTIRRVVKGFPPEFVFLDRTRYGLLRIFEQMGAKLRLRNEWEANDNWG